MCAHAHGKKKKKAGTKTIKATTQNHIATDTYTVDHRRVYRQTDRADG